MLLYEGDRAQYPVSILNGKVVFQVLKAVDAPGFGFPVVDEANGLYKIPQYPTFMTSAPLITTPAASPVTQDTFELANGYVIFLHTGDVYGHNLIGVIVADSILQIAKVPASVMPSVITDAIPVQTTDTMMLYVSINGAVKPYKRVVTSLSAPTNTSVIWFSLTENQYYEYKDGWDLILSIKIGGITMQFKRGNKSDLPQEAAAGEPLVTLDTGELYIGMGVGQALKKVSDIVLSTTEPGPEDQNKMWIDQTTNIAKAYKNGSWQVVATPSNVDYGTF